ncbi:unnamed protein product [Notodromas monacha]|uniref:Peptidase S1 domain-containing protein n=1 Tax=Notodromas monacha TaxID=399045 RepID=A0A7R9GAS4_9CRUS|nr:unnamed protein product [Notodromas monacha]CAG0915565.1 unnamed protein product [Notodromas monacha]
MRGLLSPQFLLLLIACVQAANITTGNNNAGKLQNSNSRNQSSQNDIDPVVINGYVVTDRRLGFAHLARIVFEPFPSLQSQCTGSLISPSFVLTAGHCLVKGVFKIFRWKYKNFNVTLGDLSTSETGETHEHTRSGIPLPFPFYPKFKTAIDPTDIGLLKISPQANITDYTKPIALPPSSFELPLNATVTVAGWGVSETGGDASDLLRWGSAQVDDSEACSAKLSTKQICLFDQARLQSSCNGDSGGPVMYDGYVVGTVSYGTTDCPLDSAWGAVRVSAYVTWIQIHTGTL